MGSKIGGGIGGSGYNANDREYSPNECSHVGCELQEVHEHMEDPLRREKCVSKLEEFGVVLAY